MSGNGFAMPDFLRTKAQLMKRRDIVMAENKRLVVTREGLQRMNEELEYKETT